MQNEQQRHDIDDEIWELLRPLLPGQEGQWGGIAEDNRRFLNGVFWNLRTGAPWRDLPPVCGKWNSVHQRFRRWRDSGRWERVLEALIYEPDFEWLMIDASHVKVHPHGAGAVGGNQDMGKTKGAQYQNTSGRGCEWYAGQSICYIRYHSGLYTSCCPD